jgi:hypothetical protein
MELSKELAEPRGSEEPRLKNSGLEIVVHNFVCESECQLLSKRQ